MLDTECCTCLREHLREHLITWEGIKKYKNMRRMQGKVCILKSHTPVGMQTHKENHENASLNVHRHYKGCEPLKYEYLIFGKGGNGRDKKSLSPKGATLAPIEELHPYMASLGKSKLVLQTHCTSDGYMGSYYMSIKNSPSLRASFCGELFPMVAT